MAALTIRIAAVIIAAAIVDLQAKDHAAGLIIRKRKQVHESEASDDSHKLSTSNSSIGDGLVAEDTVTLLLKHNRGYYASDDDKSSERQDTSQGKQQSKGNKPKKRVLGPERPSFLDSDSTETWVPPEGQSGDGRTSLKDRYGY